MLYFALSLLLDSKKKNTNAQQNFADREVHLHYLWFNRKHNTKLQQYS